jgi:hypothetical protein
LYWQDLIFLSNFFSKLHCYVNYANMRQYNIIADFETKRFRNLSFKLHHYVVQAHFDQIHIMAKFVKKKKKKNADFKIKCVPAGFEIRLVQI